MEETKICTKCGRELPVTDFYWRNKAEGKRRSECKYCHGNYVKNKYREKHDELEKIKMNLSCKKCGETRFYLLDFHHLDPSIKENGVAQMLRSTADWGKIEDEIKKCIPLCANCHREFHYLEREKGINIEEYLGD